MLDVRELVTGYDTEPVIRKVSFQVRDRQILTMLGHNGAGKSSVVKTLVGLLPVWQGQVLLAGYDVTYEPPWKRVQAGIAVSFQDEAVFPTMTVWKNLLLGGYVHSKQKQLIRDQLEVVFQIFPLLKARAKQLAWTLSGGQRRMLSIGMALMGDPKLLLLDEPSTGLSPVITEQVMETVRMIRDTLGKAVLLVEQNVQQALACADHVVVLKTGMIVYEGEPHRLSSDPTKLIDLF